MINIAEEQDDHLLTIAAIHYANATDPDSGRSSDHIYADTQLLRSIALTNFVMARRSTYSKHNKRD